MDSIAHPEYLLFKDRLKTFTAWPPQLSQRKENLSHAGLFYSNVSDRVTCFACGVMLYGWKPRDDPLIEHYNHARHCVYLQMIGGVRLFVLPHGSSVPSGVRDKTYSSSTFAKPRADTVDKDQPDVQ